ncbi:MAG TPA: DEAD/DEAH box helicase, partial [Actinomycetota bacterium]|nr:DEAD/DEAH box helicase [Actinomycetota bacterium]
FAREEAGLLVRPAAEVPGPATRAVERSLRERGASFLSEVAADAGLPEDEALRALFELVWVGRVTNDTLGGIREPERARGRRRARGRHPLYGRWSMVPPPVEDAAERATAWAARLLASYGVVAREMAAAAEVPTPWPLVADALATLEARGEVRRGYFVRGLSGVQYAATGAVDRLRRRSSSGGLRLVAASDPANAYGPLLPLPAERPYRLARVPGNWLVVRDGVPLLAVEGRGRRLVPLSDGVEDALPMLAELARASSRGRMAVERWDADPVVASEGAELLARAGFVRGPRQMTYRAPVA